MPSKVFAPQCADSVTPPSRKNAKAIIRTLFRICGKRWIGRTTCFRTKSCVVDTGELQQRKNWLGVTTSRYRSRRTSRSVTTSHRAKKSLRSGSTRCSEAAGIATFGRNERNVTESSQEFSHIHVTTTHFLPLQFAGSRPGRQSSK